MTAFDHRAALQQMVADYHKRAEAIRRDLSQAHDADFAEQAQQRQNDEVLEGLLAEAEQGERDARKALERIDEGVYGICERCGNDIGEARLQVLPLALRCVQCADLPD